MLWWWWSFNFIIFVVCCRNGHSNSVYVQQVWDGHLSSIEVDGRKIRSTDNLLHNKLATKIDLIIHTLISFRSAYDNRLNLIYYIDSLAQEKTTTMKYSIGLPIFHRSDVLIGIIKSSDKRPMNNTDINLDVKFYMKWNAMLSVRFNNIL